MLEMNDENVEWPSVKVANTDGSKLLKALAIFTC